MKRKPTFDFEASLNDLERLVERMEHGDLTLEESLREFATGVGLVRACQQALRAAEQQVQLLASDSQGEHLKSFSDADADKAPRVGLDDANEDLGAVPEEPDA